MGTEIKEIGNEIRAMKGKMMEQNTVLDNLTENYQKAELPKNGAKIRAGDNYYCDSCSGQKTISQTFIDENRFIRCMTCSKIVHIITDEEE